MIPPTSSPTLVEKLKVMRERDVRFGEEADATLDEAIAALSAPERPELLQSRETPPAREPVAWTVVDKDGCPLRDVHDQYIASHETREGAQKNADEWNVPPDDAEDFWRPPYTVRPLVFGDSPQPSRAPQEVTSEELRNALKAPRVEAAWAALWNNTAFPPFFSRLEFDAALAMLVGRIVGEILSARSLSDSPSPPSDRQEGTS